MRRVGSESAGHSFVHDDHARSRANLPAPGVVYPAHRLLVHQEECVTVSLNASLQAKGAGYGPVSTAWPAVCRKRIPWPSCAPRMNPALTTCGKTRTAIAFDLAPAAAGFCATSYCNAPRESLTKLADAVPVVRNVITASTRPARMSLIGLIVCSRLVYVDPILLYLLRRVYTTLGQ
jgi:hypothetical protein